MHKGLPEPHLLLAASNPYALIKNLAGILSVDELEKIRAALHAEVILLFNLGMDHFRFAKTIPKAEWRQRTSRLYYAAYNIRRALSLLDSGKFSTDSSDHKNVENLPVSLNQAPKHAALLKNLRDDRNLADYSHLAVETDLFSTLDDYQAEVEDFTREAIAFLAKAGINV